MLLFGNKQIGPIYLGNSEVTSIYQGNELIYTASVPITNYVTFTAQEANSTIGLEKLSTYQTLEYSTNGRVWNPMTTATTIILANSGDTVYIRGILSADNNHDNYTQFKMNGKIAASGNCNYLWNHENPDAPLKQRCGYYMFDGCTSLTTAPELPATTLDFGCYTHMFNGCTSLTTAPELPATTLANYCYGFMFNGCTSLTTAPELPATTLTTQCYNGMFYNCTSLTAAPELPATTLAYGCYLYMFWNCSSLTTAPELPATTLADSCYDVMFANCSSLTTAPELPATTLAVNCYRGMFNNCSNLNYIKCLATNISASNCTTNWVYSVASTGTFVKHPNMTGWTIDSGGIPTGWVVEDYIPAVKFTAQETNSTIGLERLSSNQTLEYSSDLNVWYAMTTATTITLSNSGDTTYIRGVLRVDNTVNNYTQFKMTGKVTARGNCNYLWNYENPDAPLKEYCGNRIFQGCTSLTTAPELPATTLTHYCYQGMFHDCSGLTSAPELPATTLTTQCYNGMFYNCTSLTTAPALPATTLAERCYIYMFYNCSSLTTAPALPATALANECYSYMFMDCNSLTTAPELPATTLEYGCYQGMFVGCSSLNYIKCLAVDGIDSQNTYSWVDGVADAGTFVKSPDASSWTTGDNGIPANWTIEDA